MRRAALAAVIALVGAACGGRAEVYEVAPEPQAAGARALSLPEPARATPAPMALRP